MDYVEFVSRVNECLKGRGSKCFVDLIDGFVIELKSNNGFSIGFINSYCRFNPIKFASLVIDLGNNGCRACTDCVDCKNCVRCYFCRSCVDCVGCSFCERCVDCVDCRYL